MARYNGWKNYETWNCALWLGNDEGLYNLARECRSWEKFKEYVEASNYHETPDGVRWTDPSISTREMVRFFKETFPCSK